MRKAALLAVVALSLVVAGSAYAVNATQGLKASVSPAKAGTKKKPKGITLGIETITQDPTSSGDPAFATEQAVIHFDKNLVFNGKNMPSCSNAQVQQDDSKCPAKSKVGTGTAQGVALGATENLTVKLFNGPGGNSIELLVDGSSPLTIHSTIEGKLSKDTGLYGYKLTVPIPAGLQQPAPSVYATLTDFKTKTIGTTKGKNKKPYIGLVGCPASKKLNFAGDFTYTDGTSKTATAQVPCSK
jgi:hypothetical protein